MLKNFRLRILIRIIAIVLLIGLMLYFAIIDEKYLRSIYILTFIIILISELVWYIDRTNRDINSFLMGLLQNDFTTTFSASKKGKSFSQLYDTFNQITQKFKEISAERQAQHIYLETLVEHVKVGIISFDDQEKMHLINNAFKKMIGKSNFLYLSSLQTVSVELVDALRNIQPGDQKLVKLSLGGNLLQLAIHASSFKLQNQHFKLVSVQNIKNELESNELDAWQKLIRVLTHEIMNSVTPISSLTDTLSQIAAGANDSPEVLPKIQQGLEAIKLRSEGLQTFTEAYRKLTRIPTPSFTKVNVHHLIKRVQTLFENELNAIKIEIYIPENLEIIADGALIEQVMINLIKNAIDAVSEVASPRINISTEVNEKVYITISDNGSGIEADKLDKIFVPFFTTKPDGSGVGLALSREIIRLHNGSIDVYSQTGTGTQFTVTL